MPRLDWIGKKAVEKHHTEVPFRLLKCDPKLSVGDPDSGNLLVEGDNLEALKALLPYYAGQVKCIYIDPPYNTGNENWIYNDNVNSPEIRKWLGKVVGKEAEDLSRHDKWLCMMYPRLQLLHMLLKEDGAIFISIDDNEVHHARTLLDEIFMPSNFIANIIWHKVFAKKSSAKHFSESHDHILVYAKSAAKWDRNLLPRTEANISSYSNPDSDPRGVWTSVVLSARNPYSLGIYPIKTPKGRLIEGPPKGRYWSVSKEKFEELDKDSRIWWGKSGDGVPRLKVFLSEAKEGIVPSTIWSHTEVGNTQEAKKEIIKFAPKAEEVFTTPKPTRLIKRIFQIATNRNDIVLDSFAGSGTTGHAVLELNKEDGGNRKFVMIEIESEIAIKITSPRMESVINGLSWTDGKGNLKTEEGFGGGFKYCKLGSALFDSRGQIQEEVNYKELAQHIYFIETGKPLFPNSKYKPPLIGTSDNLAVYLLYNGVLKDKSPNGGNALTRTVLTKLPKHAGPKVIYGTSCRIGKDHLRRYGITFKQIPYEIKDL